MNFPVDPSDPSKGLTATENTLFFALLTARAVRENGAAYERIRELQKGIYRFREWPLNFRTPEKMERIMAEKFTEKIYCRNYNTGCYKVTCDNPC